MKIHNVRDCSIKPCKHQKQQPHHSSKSLKSEHSLMHQKCQKKIEERVIFPSILPIQYQVPRLSLRRVFFRLPQVCCQQSARLFASKKPLNSLIKKQETHPSARLITSRPHDPARARCAHHLPRCLPKKAITLSIPADCQARGA